MRKCANIPPPLKQNTVSTCVGGNTPKSHIAVTKDSRIDTFGLARARTLQITPSGTSKTHYRHWWGGHPEITHRRDERFPNRQLGACHRKGTPLNFHRQRHHNHITARATPTTASIVIMLAIILPHSARTSRMANTQAPSTASGTTACTAWPCTNTAAIPEGCAAAALRTRHVALEGRDTCGALSGFHIVLGAT